MISFWDEYEGNITKEFKSLGSKFLEGKYITRALSPNNLSYVEKAMNKFKDDPHLDKLSEPEVIINSIPKGQKYSMNSLQQFSYIKELEKHIDLKEVNHVTDFGAGYGNFCRIWHEVLDYKGTYTSVDLPTMHEIQKHFLDFDIEYKNWKDDLTPPSKSLFVATFSISECSMEIRDKVEEDIQKHDYIFIIHNRQFDGIDNLAWGKDLVKRLDNHDTEYFFEDISSKWWLIGKRK